jgi:hypothetical protein
MDRLYRLINILKLTPHRQPDLVKEATHRLLNRNIRYDPKVDYYLKHIIEIILTYCDDDDGVQRSLFNDYLNNVILAFQDHCYQTILHVLVEEVTNNGSARTVTAALLRIPLLINNVQPIELGCDPQKLLKSLIEVSRRVDDESVQKALESTLSQVMPYLDYSIRSNKETHFLSNILAEVLLKNLSTSTRRYAVSCLEIISRYSLSQSQSIVLKLKEQLDSISSQGDSADNLFDANKFIGLCMAIRKITEFTQLYACEIIKLLLQHIIGRHEDTNVIIAALEASRETIIKFDIDDDAINQDLVDSLVDKFLLDRDDHNQLIIKPDTKVILQSNTLSLILAIIQRKPNILQSEHIIVDCVDSGNSGLDLLGRLLILKDHSDMAVRNQVYYLIGSYIDACWKTPCCTGYSLSCDRVRELWSEFRKVLHDDTTHPNVVKSCLTSMSSCINTIINSDHCLHIVTYNDFDRLIHLYSKSNFKPLKVEMLHLFAKLDYLTLNYLDMYHWSRMRLGMPGSLTENLQARILDEVIMASLTDESQMIRLAASSALLSVVPRLYVGTDNQRSCDPIVSLASDLTEDHLSIFEQTNSQINSGGDDISTTNLRPNEEMIIRSGCKILSSSILREDNFNGNQLYQPDANKRNISTNLTKIINLLRTALEASLSKGKSAVLSIVKTFLELSKAYPVHQYPSSWDCRPSEHCECFTLLNFLLTYLENLTDPDVVIEDLDAYQTFLALSTNLLYALCYESVFLEYENQRMMPYYKRLISAREIGWTELTIKHPPIAVMLQIYFTHLVKLLWLISYVVAEKNNPFSATSKNQQYLITQDESHDKNHSNLISNRLLFGKIHKKLESSYRSSKKNLRKDDEKFQQILETSLSSLSSLLEFMSTNQTKYFVKDILSYLKIISPISNVSSLKCARQLLKSLFGINIIALYQVDPLDWFEEESSIPQDNNSIVRDAQDPSLQGVYHHLVSRPYKVFSNYLSNNCSQITQESDRALAAMDFESRRSLKVRYRIEEIIKSLFEFHPHQLITPRIREVSELLKNTIAEFTPVVMECMKKFTYGGFCDYQSEVLHFMSYLILLRVNYQKLPMANDFIQAVHRILDECVERRFIAKENEIEKILSNSFTFLILLTYQRGPNQPMFHIAAVIQKLDDLRATLSLASGDKDTNKYIVPLLRCLVEDLFIYRTEQFQNTFLPKEENTSASGELVVVNSPNQVKQDLLEAERETVAHKLLTVIEHTGAYDLLSILLLESRLNPDGTNYEKLSQRLFIILPEMFIRYKLDLADPKRLELTKRIFESISTEVFKPVSFIIRTLLEIPSPPKTATNLDFQRWMSLVIVDLHILTTQVKEEKFLARISESIGVKPFIQYLFQIIQLCAAEIFISLSRNRSYSFLVQQLTHYIYYINYMFQSGLFFELTKIAPDLINTESHRDIKMPENFWDLCMRAREPSQEFSISICETIFYYLRYCHPDLTVMWCNLMMMLNQVDCNNDFWCDLLIYDCHHCQGSMFVRPQIKEPENGYDSTQRSERPVKRPSSLNLLMGDGIEDQRSQNTRAEQKDDNVKSNIKRSHGRSVNRPSSLNLLDISFKDQLRRSFIKRIAASESRPKNYERNPAGDTCLDDDPSSINEDGIDPCPVGQCLAPNIELSRRGALCLVLDFVSISMDDVEHITWLIIHHINDIIRWSHEMPIAEFISAVHGTSASSGIFIQAIDTNTNDLTSLSFVTRLLWSLEKVHYTQYGSLVVLLVEKLLSSPDLMTYRVLTKKVEDFACEAVRKLLNDTNKNLITTNEETINQLTPEDLDKIISMLDRDLYPKLTELLFELRNS